MKAEPQFVTHILEQMRGIGPVRARPMFGGYGIYCEDLMFGLVAYDTLYFKVDDVNQSDFEEAESTPFTYEAKGKSMIIRYYRAPDEVMDDEAVMQRWAESGLAAARRAQAKKGVRNSNKTKPVRKKP